VVAAGRNFAFCKLWIRAKQLNWHLSSVQFCRPVLAFTGKIEPIARKLMNCFRNDFSSINCFKRNLDKIDFTDFLIIL